MFPVLASLLWTLSVAAPESAPAPRYLVGQAQLRPPASDSAAGGPRFTAAGAGLRHPDAEYGRRFELSKGAANCNDAALFANGFEQAL